FRMSVMSALAGDLELLGGAGTYALELFGNHISYALGGLLILWMIAPFVLSVLFFKKRCFA
ncbi:MAG: hypothetical protein HY586_02345, partial [Candidatus Omnitrophica bacterium]|nr:hypothetical protein [Candidatus Omnitrophota bacterium]